MAGRDLAFPLRLSAAERDDLARQAAEKGVTAADLIRGFLGWEPGGLEPRATPSRPRAPRKAPSPGKPKPTPPARRPRSSEPPPLSELLRRVADRESR